MNCCSLQQIFAIWAEFFKDPVYIAINVAAFFVGWNLTKWWRALTRKPAENIGEQAREQYGDRQHFGNPELLRHDPHPKLHGPEYIANNPNFNPFRNFKSPEKVVEGEVIRSEPLRIEHDNRRIEHDT